MKVPAGAVAVLVAAGLLLATGPAAGAAVEVFAAASTGQAMQVAIDRFRGGSGPPMRLSTAASSRLAMQILRGAPAAVFVSANVAWMDRLEAQSLLAPGSRRPLLGNRLALLGSGQAAAGPALTAESDVADWLGPDRLVLADPDHVPAGIYARQALAALGLWPRLDGRLAYAGSAAGVVRLLATGQSRFGVAYASDARLSPKVRALWLFPAASHDPIVYPVALLRGRAAAPARQFHAFLLGPEAGRIFAEHGFRHLPTGTDPRP